MKQIKRIKGDPIKLLQDVQDVIRQYPGVKMTVRQVYYRLVAAGKLPNHASQYVRVKKCLTDARLNGSVSFSDIEDRTRKITEGDKKERSAKSYFDLYHNWFRTLDQNYELPRWYGQPIRVVVLVEKQALEGIFSKVCTDRAVDLLVCRGYPSISVLHDLAVRLKDRSSAEIIKMLYFGDYDPSGLDIDRNVAERLRGSFAVQFDFERMAITREQIDEYDIPPAPAKEADPRTAGMEADTGEAMQVELDAIDPPDLTTIIEDSIDQYFDEDIYDNERLEEQTERRISIADWVKSVLKEAK